jgi:hypothetical protein
MHSIVLSIEVRIIQNMYFPSVYLLHCSDFINRMNTSGMTSCVEGKAMKMSLPLHKNANKLRKSFKPENEL